MAKSGLIAASLGAGLLSLVAVAGEHPAPPADAESRAATALAAEVEEMVARSKPDSWEMRRACLYYALAGQHLLARHGISATLWVGTVVYDPETMARHRIHPHAWLETATHFIDYSTLPRWGQVTVIPHEVVASDPLAVNPGVTRVLALHRPADYDLVDYLAAHRARFDRIVNGEASPSSPPPSAPP